MIGNSDSNRSEGQGGCREALSAKEVCSKGTTVGTRTDREAEVRAMSVLGNAKSDSHRKTHQVESDGPGRKFMHLTRGDLRRESGGGVSRGHSSEEARGNAGRAKGRRTKRERSTDRPATRWRAAGRNTGGVAIAAATSCGVAARPGWTPRAELNVPCQSTRRSKEVRDDAQ